MIRITTVSINGTVQSGAAATVMVDIAGDKTTEICFTNKVTNSNIPNDSSAVVNGMKPTATAGEYTLVFEKKKELGQGTPNNTTSD